MRPLERKERQERFEMKTTKDYYREFPGLIRSSTPLYIKSAGIQVLDKFISTASSLTPLVGGTQQMFMQVITAIYGKQQPDK